MTAENGAFHYGKVRYPLLPQTAGADLLSLCDPTVSKLLEFLPSVLTTYIGPAFVSAATGESPITAMVAETISVNPSDLSKVDQLSFPLFAIWRDRSEKSLKTSNYQQSAWKMRVAYILPPLSAEQAIKLHPVLNAVGQVIANRLHLGYDPAYNNGERIFLGNDIAACRIVSSEIGRWDVDKGLDFHGWFGELALREQEMPTTEGLQTLTLTSVQLTDQSTQEGNPADVIDAVIR
jgi:hypothetical protein